MSPLLEMPGEFQVGESQDEIPLNPSPKHLPPPEQVEQAKKEIVRLMDGNPFQTVVYEDIIINNFSMSYFEHLEGRRRDYHTIQFDRITQIEIEKIPNAMKGRNYALTLHRPEGKNKLQIFMNKENDIRELYNAFQIMTIYARQISSE